MCQVKWVEVWMVCVARDETDPPRDPPPRQAEEWNERRVTDVCSYAEGICRHYAGTGLCGRPRGRILVSLVPPPQGALFHQHGTGSALVRAPNFERLVAFWPKINWLGTWKVGSQLEPKNSWFSMAWSVNCDNILFYRLEREDGECHSSCM